MISPAPREAFAPPPLPALQPIEPITVDRGTAAALLHISEKTLERMQKAGEVPFVRIRDRVLFSVAALREWVADGCPRPGGAGHSSPQEE